MKQRRVVRAKLAQQAREQYKDGIVDEMPAHSVDVTPGWKASPVVIGERYDVYRFEGTAETAIPRHRHPDHLEIVYVVKGEVNLRIGREDEMLGPGDAKRIDPDVEHEIICASRNTTILSIFQPPISIGPGGKEDVSLDYQKIFQKHK